MPKRSLLSALAAVKKQLATSPRPAVEACRLAGQKSFAAWGVDLGLSEPIPLKAAYWLLQKKYGAPPGDAPDFSPHPASRVFEKLGVQLVRKSRSYWLKILATENAPPEIAYPTFEFGRTYSRRTLQKQLGGQINGRIITPTRASVVIAVSGISTQKDTRHDSWTDDGVFLFIGEWHDGPTALGRNNKAIQDHVPNDHALHLFQATERSGALRYAGEFICESYHLDRANVYGGTSRSVVAFHLVPLERLVSNATSMAKRVGSRDQSQSAMSAFEAMRPAQVRSMKDVIASARQRREAIVAYVLARAKGACELCGEASPFKCDSGRRYLEAHEINKSSDGGLSYPGRMGALCPNCHRAVHVSIERRDLNKKLQAIIDNKERAASAAFNGWIGRSSF